MKLPVVSCNAAAMVGRAVPTAVRSSALKKMETMIAAKLSQNALLFPAGFAGDSVGATCSTFLSVVVELIVKERRTSEGKQVVSKLKEAWPTHQHLMGIAVSAFGRTVSRQNHDTCQLPAQSELPNWLPAVCDKIYDKIGQDWIYYHF